MSQKERQKERERAPYNFEEREPGRRSFLCKGTEAGATLLLK